MEADEQFFIKLQQGYRMDKPKYSTKQIYDIMQECWFHDPNARPDFMRLSELLGQQLEATVRRHYIDLNDSYVQANATTESPDYLSMMSPVDYVNVGSRSSPMPPPRQSSYINIPSNDDELGGNRQSDYLSMGTAPPTGSNYLMMTSPTPSSGGGDSTRFEFPANAESVEMRPMLKKEQEVNGFSNPNYQNPPPAAIIKCSDLDDPPPPPSYVNIPPTSETKEEELHYVNPKNNSKFIL